MPRRSRSRLLIFGAKLKHLAQVSDSAVAVAFLGMGEAALLYATVDGDPIRPDKLSRDWANILHAKELPKISFHGLRHSNVSLLIDGGLGVYQVSRRIGHGNASLTLKTYMHLFRNKEDEAVEAIEDAFRR